MGPCILEIAFCESSIIVLDFAFYVDVCINRPIAVYA